MPQNIRIATFNCNNLFTRPRIFKASAQRAQELLGFVAQLEAELRKEVFDKAKIKQLLADLEGYAYLNEVRGKYDSNNVVGSKEWLGWVELSRQGAEDIAVENTARVIGDVNADVICLMEIENRFALQKFHDDMVLELFFKPAQREGYERVILIDGNDPRYIDVAVMSRRPINFIRTHIHERIEYDGKMVPTFSRDCLEVEIDMPDGKPLLLLVNHLKSQGYSPPTDFLSRRRRKGQATAVAAIVNQRNLQQDYVVVAGDLNDNPSSTALVPLLTLPGLHNLNLELPEGQRGTYKGIKDKDQIDYLLVSDPLKNKLKQPGGVFVDRRGVYTSGTKWIPYPTITGTRSQASDHGSVVADFEF